MSDTNIAAAALDATRGVTTTAGLIALGFSRDRIAKLACDGVIISIGHGLWRFVGAVLDERQHAMAAVVASGAGALASHATAAWLHEMLSDPAPTAAHVLIPHRRTVEARLPAVRIHRSRTLSDLDVDEVDGIPCTTPARTLVDLAASRSVNALREMAARGLRLGILTLEDASLQLERAGRLRGLGRLRPALGQLGEDDGQAQSRAEQLLYDALIRAGVKGLERQVEIRTEAGTFHVDLAVEASRLVLEVDGYWWHSTPQQKRRDEQRQNAIVLTGWRVLRFGAAEVQHNVDRVVATVLTALS